MRRRITLVERQDRARRSFEEKQRLAEARQAEAKRKLSERLEQIQLQAKEKVGHLRQDIRALECQVAPVTRMVFPTPGQREAIKTFRARNGWSVRSMAKACEVDSRQIQAIESDTLSIYMAERSFNRILRRVDLPALPETTVTAVRVRNRKRPVDQRKLVPPAVLAGAGRARPEDPIVIPGDSKYVWPDQSVRDQIKNFRLQSGWSIYQMVKATRYEYRRTASDPGQIRSIGRQSIEQLEGPRPTIWMYVDTLDRLLKVCGFPPLQIAGQPILETSIDAKTAKGLRPAENPRWQKDLTPAEIETVHGILRRRAAGLSDDQIRQQMGMAMKRSFLLIEQFGLSAPPVIDRPYTVGLDQAKPASERTAHVEVKDGSVQELPADDSESEWLEF